MASTCSRTPAATFLLLPLLLISLSSSHQADAGCRFKAIFNFGDSNSDTGGFWAAFPAQNGPYGITFFHRHSGRASDGRVFIDFLAQALGLPFLSPYLRSIGSDFQHGANFATAASTVLMPNTSVFVSGISPFYLSVQFNQMKDFRDRLLGVCSIQNTALHLRSRTTLMERGRVEGRKIGRTEGNLPPPDIIGQAVYTLDIGQNDFTSDLAIIGIEGVKQYLPQVAYQIGRTIEELYDIGGRTFLVFNLAPIGCFPAFLKELPHSNSDLDEYGCMVSYNKAVVDYNNLLNQTLQEIRDQLSDASVIYVDTHSVKLELYQHPKTHGFSYSTRACCGHGGGDYNFDPGLFCGNTKEINGCFVTANACPDPENYVSWDGIHATEAANKLLTMAILNGSYFYPPFPLFELCELKPIG
uniref:Lanatoside 15-O-acetylesterase n=1 Tax=Paphiopedilum concolor TaxID=53078 RepID=A0A0A6Z832_9ASPA|nr:lanatoside 15-O-acetylesterase [Paphiopedilum concolor]